MMQCVATQQHLAADAAGAPIEPALDRALATPGPVTLMLHGFRYCPFHVPDARDPALHDPHRLIYSHKPEAVCDKVVSWPQMLGRPGPVIGIGWPAMHDCVGTMAAMRGFAQVYARAEGIGRQVARLADMIAARDPGRRIDIVGHSLGARVALCALPRLMRAAPARVLLWGAAERAGVAQRLVAQAPARTGIINVTARGNARYDALFNLAAPRAACGANRPLGTVHDLDGMTTLTLDDPQTERSLAARGLHLAPARQRACHWSFYTRAGTGRLYAALLDQPGLWTVERIAALSEPEFARPSALATLSGWLPVNRMRGA